MPAGRQRDSPERPRRSISSRGYKVSSHPITHPVAAARDQAYTLVRPDVTDLVPPSAVDVLDVGCSNGALGRALKALSPGRRVCGIELDGAFAAQAARHLDLVVHADVAGMDWRGAFDGRTFDCIVFADILEHLVDPGACLDGALALLRPGGSVVVSLPNVRHVAALWTIFCRGHFPRRERGLFDRTHLRWFSIDDARRLLTERHLRIAAIHPSLRWGDRGGGRANRLLNKLPPRAKNWAPVREFLTYQMGLRGERA